MDTDDVNRRANREVVLPLIKRVKDAGLTGASFDLLDDEGVSWHVELEWQPLG